MKKFNYILLDGPPDQEKFNEIGAKGWELVWIFDTLGDKTSIFKKEKEEEKA